jgi:hypothetical protein
LASQHWRATGYSVLSEWAAVRRILFLLFIPEFLTEVCIYRWPRKRIRNFYCTNRYQFCWHGTDNIQVRASAQPRDSTLNNVNHWATRTPRFHLMVLLPLHIVVVLPSFVLPSSILLNSPQTRNTRFWTLLLGRCHRLLLPTHPA